MFDLPVTVIAGYLGSGKTTYLNRRLKEANGLRYGVLVNDFGELNIDAALIESESTRSISLVNGCVCCSISGDVEGALDELRLQADILDWILLEASGVADPSSVCNRVLNWPGFRLSETITLVDASRIRRLVNDKFVGLHIQAQLSNPESLLLSKTDLLDRDELSKLELWLAQRIGKQQKAAPMLNAETHHWAYHTKSIRHKEPVSRCKFESWLNKFDSNVIRIKGFVKLAEDLEQRYLLQWVEGTWTLELSGAWINEPETNLVLISHSAEFVEGVHL
ncbi:MAG: GTP-binding protein [Pseudomonadales bacterium]|jgi:G3E family GTPase